MWEKYLLLIRCVLCDATCSDVFIIHSCVNVMGVLIPSLKSQ